MIRRMITAAVALLAALAVNAQNYKISLQLQDAATSEAVGFATVSVNPEYAMLFDRNTGEALK